MIDLEPWLRHSYVMRRRSIPQLVVRLFIVVKVLRPWLRESIIVALMVVLLPETFGIDFTPKRNVAAENIALALVFGLTGVWVYIHRASFAQWAHAADTEGTDANGGSSQGSTQTTPTITDDEAVRM